MDMYFCIYMQASSACNKMHKKFTTETLLDYFKDRNI